ncbi:putative zinc-binding protein [Methanohalophilus sp.]|uniref:putative zinc-binding protein n=1 Tax=Methanohalophilus sp. TaxID=1966352 RepID=UPI002627626D|nr:putative zinc-binding protein [Methanohalophilus sp.]MDK2891822.1 hypothetical protein [Methanohalophilus sp.]
MVEGITCSCGSENVAIYPCSGGSNVGQISNKVAVELTKAEAGKIMCTAGIGGRVPGQIKSAEGCDRIIVIDGCPMHCALKTLENAGLSVDKHIVITELGMKKSKDLDIDNSTISDAMEKILKII